MHIYLVRIHVKNGPGANPRAANTFQEGFWRDVAGRSRVNSVLSNARALRELSAIDGVLTAGAFDAVERALKDGVRSKLPERLSRYGCDARLNKVEIGGYGSVDILLYFEKALNSIAEGVLTSLVASCVAEVFDVPEGQLWGDQVSEAEEEKVDRAADSVQGIRTANSAGEAGASARVLGLAKSAVQPLTIGGSLILVGFMAFSLVDRITSRLNVADGHYAKLVEYQLELTKQIMKLNEQIAARSDANATTCDSSRNVLVDRVLADATALAEARKGPPYRGGATMCDLLKPQLAPASLRLVVEPAAPPADALPKTATKAD